MIPLPQTANGSQLSSNMIDSFVVATAFEGLTYLISQTSPILHLFFTLSVSTISRE